MSRAKTTKPAPKRTRAAQALATRAKLTAAALELFARQGYAATSTRQIAKAAGVSEGLIFHHFPTKLDLLMGTMSQHEIFAHRIVAVLANAEDKPIRTQLEAIAQGFVATLAPERKETQAFRLMLGESMTNPDLGQLFKQTQILVFGTIEHYLEARIEAGELRADLDVAVATRALLGGFFFFFVSNQRLSTRAWRKQSTDYVAELSKLWLRGTLADPSLA